jgi:hypothetical protein
MPVYAIEKEPSGDGFTDIPATHYKKIVDAKNQLIRIVQIEERYAMLLENYVAFERDMLTHALELTVSGSRDWSDLTDAKRAMNRHIVNLLTTCRLYFDQVSSLAKKLPLGESSLRENFEQMRNNEYGSVFSYRLMEALRNFVQHNDLPVHGLTYRSYGIDATDPSSDQMRGLYLELDVRELRRDKKFKATVISEIDASDQFINLDLHIRRYIECIGGIQGKIRRLIESDIKIAEAIFENVIGLSSDDVSSRRIGAEVWTLSDDRRRMASEVISLDLPRRVRHLQIRYRANVPLSRTVFVSRTEKP